MSRRSVTCSGAAGLAKRDFYAEVNQQHRAAQLYPRRRGKQGRRKRGHAECGDRRISEVCRGNPGAQHQPGQLSVRQGALHAHQPHRSDRRRHGKADKRGFEQQPAVHYPGRCRENTIKSDIFVTLIDRKRPTGVPFRN